MPQLTPPSPSAVRHPLLAREGWVHIGIALAIAVGVHAWLGGWAAAPFWLLLVFIVQFFRDPPRAVPIGAGMVVAPADGRVVAVGDIQDPYLKRPAKRVSIFMNVFNVHANRTPVAGKVMHAWYHPGKFLNAVLDKASEANERNALWIKTPEGHDVVVVQVAGLIARRILCYVGRGAEVGRGQRYGFIRFGSRVDVYLPVNARVAVAIGDKTVGGSQVIAEFSS